MKPQSIQVRHTGPARLSDRNKAAAAIRRDVDAVWAADRRVADLADAQRRARVSHDRRSAAHMEAAFRDGDEAVGALIGAHQRLTADLDAYRSIEERLIEQGVEIPRRRRPLWSTLPVPDISNILLALVVNTGSQFRSLMERWCRAVAAR